MLLAGGTVRAEVETITISDYTPSSGNIPCDASSPIRKGAVTIYIEKKSTSTPGLYKKDHNLRLYSSDILHINAGDNTITEIAFTGTTALTDVASGKWTGSSNAVALTGTGTNKITKIEVTYTGSTLTETTTTFGAEVDEKTFEVKVGEEAAFVAPKAKLSPAGAGTLTYSSSNPSAVDVDAQTGDLTFHATGTATITASFAATDAYGSSSNYYVVKYYNPNAITFSVKNGSFDNAGSKYPDTETTLNFPASDGNSYAFACTNVMTGPGNVLQMQKSGGKAVSPVFSSTYGYKVRVCYFTTNNATPLTLTSGALTAAGVVTGESGSNATGIGFAAELSIPSAKASFTIKAGSVASYVSSIEITKFTTPQAQPSVTTFAKEVYTIQQDKESEFVSPVATVVNADNDPVESTGLVTYAISVNTFATINAQTGAVTVLSEAPAPNSAKVTATFAGNAAYAGSSASYTLKYLARPKASSVVTFGETVDQQAFRVFQGKESEFTAKTATTTTAEGAPIEGAVVTYASSDAAIATVDENTGEVTFGEAYGRVTITASYAGNDTYYGASSSYTLIYVPTMDEGVLVFEQAYAGFDSIPSAGYQNGTFKLLDQYGKEYQAELTDAYRNSGGIQMKKTSGEVRLPAFETTYGYRLVVNVKTNNVSLTAGELTVDGADGVVAIDVLSSTVGVVMSVGSSYAVVEKIQVIPFPTPQAQPTVVAFDQTDYHAYKGEESKFQSPAATVTTATGEAVEGATVTYAISENSFATINAQTGVVTIQSDAEPGTATVTASFAGIQGYLASAGTYTLHYNKAAYTDIAALKAGASSDELVRVKLTDAQVVYVNGKNVYLRDASAAIELYEMTYPFAEGMVLNGYINATYGFSYGMPSLTAGEVDAVLTEAAVEPYVLNTDDAVAHVGDLVRVNLARVAADGTISNGTQAGLTYYDKFKTGLKAPYEDATVSMTAIVIAYLPKNATELIYELAPVDAEALTYVFDEASRVATADVATARVELRRSLHEGWNTFCVPFALTQAQLENAYGVDVKAKKLANVDSDNGTLTLQFEAEAEGGIQANVPYLIRVSAPIASTVFTGVTIVEALAEPSTMLSGCTFQACYHSTPVAAEAGNYALSASGGSFKAVTEPMEIPSMQAYIVLPTDGATYLFDYYEPADEVGITGVEADEAEGEWYNLQGVRVAEPTGKGLYLRGGRKVWVK